VRQVRTDVAAGDGALDRVAADAGVAGEDLGAALRVAADWMRASEARTRVWEARLGGARVG
jgi:hypothetical protein